MPPLVQIESVDMRYGGPEGTLAVSGLDVTVEKGQFKPRRVILGG